MQVGYLIVISKGICIMDKLLNVLNIVWDIAQTLYLTFLLTVVGITILEIVKVTL